LISQKRLLGGLFVWRGLNVGTGFFWQNTSLGLTTSIIPEEDLPSFSIETISETINMRFNEVFHLGIDTNTFIVPIEAMTSIRLFGFLNAALGAGVDIAFGSSSISAHGSFDADLDSVSGLPLGVTMDRAPGLSYRLEGKSAPSIFNLKIMGAAGFNLGPVIIDIPVTYYFLENGYSFGFTFGLTF
jgi:hypothetical protein